jgi:pyruvate kinase
MNRIIFSIEAQNERKSNDSIPLKSPKALMLKSAMFLSDELPGCSIAVFTRSGYLARTLSALRPRKSPIFAFTDQEEVFQNLLMYWGVEPFLMSFKEDPEATIQEAFARLKSRGWVESRNHMVVVSNVLAGRKIIDTIQYRPVP